MRNILRSRYLFSTVPSWATVDPFTLNGSKPHTVSNILDGKVVKYGKTVPVIDPVNGEVFINASTPTGKELDAFI